MPPKSATQRESAMAAVHHHSALGRTSSLLKHLSNEQVTQLKNDERTFLLDPNGGYVGCFAPTVGGTPCRFTSNLPSQIPTECGVTYTHHEFCFLKRRGGPKAEAALAHFECVRTTCPSRKERYTSDWEENNERPKIVNFKEEGSQRYYDFLYRTAQSGGGDGYHHQGAGSSGVESEQSGSKSQGEGMVIVGSEKIRNSKTGVPATGPPSGMANLFD